MVDAAATTSAGCMDRRGNLGVEADDEGGRTSAPRRRARYVLAIYEGWMMNVGVVDPGRANLGRREADLRGRSGLWSIPFSGERVLVRNHSD